MKVTYKTYTAIFENNYTHLIFIWPSIMQFLNNQFTLKTILSPRNFKYLFT